MFSIALQTKSFECCVVIFKAVEWTIPRLFNRAVHYFLLCSCSVHLWLMLSFMLFSYFFWLQSCECFWKYIKRDVHTWIALFYLDTISCHLLLIESQNVPSHFPKLKEWNWNEDAMDHFIKIYAFISLSMGYAIVCIVTWWSKGGRHFVRSYGLHLGTQNLLGLYRLIGSYNHHLPSNGSSTRWRHIPYILYGTVTAWYLFMFTVFQAFLNVLTITNDTIIELWQNYLPGRMEISFDRFSCSTEVCSWRLFTWKDRGNHQRQHSLSQISLNFVFVYPHFVMRYPALK